MPREFNISYKRDGVDGFGQIQPCFFFLLLLFVSHCYLRLSLHGSFNLYLTWKTNQRSSLVRPYPPLRSIFEIEDNSEDSQNLLSVFFNVFADTLVAALSLPCEWLLLFIYYLILFLWVDTGYCWWWLWLLLHCCASTWDSLVFSKESHKFLQITIKSMGMQNLGILTFSQDSQVDAP